MDARDAAGLWRVVVPRSASTALSRCNPMGWLVVEDDGAVVGTGCCVAYPEGKFGWIGLVATARVSAQGIATAITEYLADVLAVTAAHRCSMPRLPVARSTSGWASSTEDLTTVMGVPATDDRGRRSTAMNVEPLTADDLDEVVRFDAPRFGATRRAAAGEGDRPASRQGAGVAAPREGRRVSRRSRVHAGAGRRRHLGVARRV